MLETWQWFKLQTYALQKGNATLKWFFGDKTFSSVTICGWSVSWTQKHPMNSCAQTRTAQTTQMSPDDLGSIAVWLSDQSYHSRQQSKQSVPMLECFSRWFECGGRSLEQTCCLYDFLTVAGGFNSYWAHWFALVRGKRRSCTCLSNCSLHIWESSRCRCPSDAQHAPDTSRPPLQIMQHSLH